MKRAWERPREAVYPHLSFITGMAPERAHSR